MPSARNLAHIGLDVGSTTVKVVIFNADAEAIYARYQRHLSDVRATVAHKPWTPCPCPRTVPEKRKEDSLFSRSRLPDRAPYLWRRK